MSLAVFEVVAFQQPPLPPRSGFYSLRPIGIGTPHVESLTGYITRLAQEHCVSIHTLLTNELVVRIARSVDQSQSGLKVKRTDIQMVSINGVTPLAESWVRFLGSLTHRRDLRALTMLAWADVLPWAGLLRAKLAWCPDCLNEQATAYEPLLWCIKAVETCPQHRRMLQSHCSHCSESQRGPFRQTCLSYCSKCRMHLGGDSGKRGSENSVSDDQLWVANAVGEMLAASQDSEVPKRRLSETLRLALQQGNANESLAATARRWGKRSVTVRAWLNGKRTPQLGSLLDICRTFDTSPLLLLTLEQARTQSDRTATVCAEAGRPGNWTSHRRINLKELKSKLEAVLRSGGDVPLSLAEVCRRLGYGRDLIYRHFPERCRAISQSHAGWRAKRSARRKQVLSDEVRRVAESLHEAGREPTLREVASRLTTPGSMRERIARETLAQIRLELGPVRR